MELMTVKYRVKKNNKVVEKKMTTEKWQAFYSKSWNKIELLDII